MKSINLSIMLIALFLLLMVASPVLSAPNYSSCPPIKAEMYYITSISWFYGYTKIDGIGDWVPLWTLNQIPEECKFNAKNLFVLHVYKKDMNSVNAALCIRLYARDFDTNNYVSFSGHFVEDTIRLYNSSEQPAFYIYDIINDEYKLYVDEVTTYYKNINWLWFDYTFTKEDWKQNKKRGWCFYKVSVTIDDCRASVDNRNDEQVTIESYVLVYFHNKLKK